MANVMFKKGLLAALPTTYAEGTFYVTTDERAIYLDVSDSARIRLGDFQEFATVAALEANTNPSASALYYVADINCLAKWNGTAYVQINRDTGFTSIEVTGDGNAVTAIAVDETNDRKLVITKGATFATKAELDALNARVGEIPEGYTEETVIAYINKKAEETLNAASGGSSESAASVLAALNTYKSENDPKVQANTDAIDAIEADYLKAADKTELQGNIDDVAERMTTAEGEIDALQEASAKHALATDLTAEVDRAKAAEEANAAAAKAAQDDVDALEAKVGTVADGKTVVEMISDAQSAATYDDTEVKADITELQGEVETLIGEDTGKSVRAIAEEEAASAINEFSTNISDDNVVNSYKELIDWVATHGGEAAEMTAAIEALEAIVAGIGGEGEQPTVVAYVAAAIEALKIGDYAKAADLTALAERVTTAEGKITTLEGASHTHGNKDELDKIVDGDKAKWDAVVADHLTAADKTELEGDIAAAQAAAEKVANDNNAAMDTRMQAVEGKAHEHANKAELDKIADGDVAKWNAAEQNAKDYADGLAGNYDASGAAAAVQGETDKTVKDVVDILTWGSF